MRVVREVLHPACKITVFDWNNRYLIKFEQGYFEQTYKFSQLDVDEQTLNDMLDDDFINDVLDMFTRMAATANSAYTRHI